MNCTEELFLRLSTSFDFHKLSRSQWREISSGSDRYLVQQTLLELAEGARVGTRADRLALLKAAHAVLPLHGSALLETARLIIESARSGSLKSPVPLEWCDILIEALAEQPHRNNPISVALLDTLCVSIENAGDHPIDRLRVEVLLHQVFSLGYRPKWMPARVADKALADAADTSRARKLRG